MPTRPTDVSKLWGRAGGRCALCRMQPTAVALDGVLAEAAHIVARSAAGPRGDDPLPQDNRDRYSNLILLCPNHHTEVDWDTATWTVTRLLEAKHEHERWVQDQLDRGLLTPRADEVAPFREARVREWGARSDNAWAFSALTPLELSEDALDVVAPHVVTKFQGLSLPAPLHLPIGGSVNAYFVEPTMNGLAVEDFRRLADGVGYRVELYRSGHCEIAVCLDAWLDAVDSLSEPDARIYQSAAWSEHRLRECTRLLQYEQWAEIIVWSIATLSSIWEDLDLPFQDAILTCAVAVQPSTCLIAARGNTTRVGRPSEHDGILHSLVSRLGDVGHGPLPWTTAYPGATGAGNGGIEATPAASTGSRWRTPWSERNPAARSRDDTLGSRSQGSSRHPRFVSMRPRSA